MKIKIITFGYLWGAAPEATLTVDLRGRLVNPYKDTAMRELTGYDSVIYHRVMDTPGALTLADGLYAAVTALALSGKDVTLAVGCSGGRHRSVAVARAVAHRLRTQVGSPYEVELVDRDIPKGVFVHK